jgi:hypothetical protein
MANSTLANLTASGALTGTELFYSDNGAADVKVTANQLKTFVVGAGAVTVASGKTLTVSNTLTLAGTDGSTLNVGAGGTLGTAAFVNTGTSGGTVPLLNAGNTFSATQTIHPGRQCQRAGGDGLQPHRRERAGPARSSGDMEHKRQAERAEAQCHRYGKQCRQPALGFAERWCDWLCCHKGRNGYIRCRSSFTKQLNESWFFRQQHRSCRRAPLRLVL